MSNTPRTAIDIRTFDGMHSSADPHDIPQGASVEQINISCQTAGSIEVRPGMRPVTFESVTIEDPQDDETNVDPPPPSPSNGACCLPDTECRTITRAECIALGGTYQGNGSLCADVTCSPAASGNTGACCQALESNCSVITEVECTTIGGYYAGDDTDCGDCAADGEPLGACCRVIDGVSYCVIAKQSECDVLGGEYMGDSPEFGCAPLCTNGGAGYYEDGSPPPVLKCPGYDTGACCDYDPDDTGYYGGIGGLTPPTCSMEYSCDCSGGFKYFQGFATTCEDDGMCEVVTDECNGFEGDVGTGEATVSYGVSTQNAIDCGVSCVGFPNCTEDPVTLTWDDGQSAWTGEVTLTQLGATEPMALSMSCMHTSAGTAISNCASDWSLNGIAVNTSCTYSAMDGTLTLAFVMPASVGSECMLGITIVLTLV